MSVCLSVCPCRCQNDARRHFQHSGSITPHHHRHCCCCCCCCCNWRGCARLFQLSLDSLKVSSSRLVRRIGEKSIECRYPRVMSTDGSARPSIRRQLLPFADHFIAASHAKRSVSWVYVRMMTFERPTGILFTQTRSRSS